MPSRPSLLAFSGCAAAVTFLLNKAVPSASPHGFIGFLAVLSLEYTAWFVWAVVLYPRFFSPLRHLPQPSDGHWLLGQTQYITKEASGEPMLKWINTVPNNGLIYYRNFLQDRLLLTSPSTIGEVLVTKAYDFVKPGFLRDGPAQILGLGILFAEGDEHKKQRRNIQPAFAFRHIKNIYPVFWKKSQEMAACISKASQATAPPSALDGLAVDEGTPRKESAQAVAHAPGTIEVTNWVSRATLDIIGVSGMGQDFDSLHNPGNKLNQTYKSLNAPPRGAFILRLARGFLPFWLLRSLPLKRNDEMSEAVQFIRQTCRDLIVGKRQHLEKGDAQGIDIVSVLMQSGQFTDEQLIDQVMTFLLAGHETTATAMSWTIYLLCRHPEVQQKLRDEVRKHIKSLATEISASDIDECHYLHAVCSEVLRLQSPVRLTMRQAAVDSTVNGQVIPKGTVVIVAPYAVNNADALWSDAREFKPERWLDDAGRSNNKGGAESNFSFLTFLHGPRSCIGMKFAQAEFACMLAAWVGKFDTQFEQGSPLARGEYDVRGGITAKIKDGVWVNLKEVEGW